MIRNNSKVINKVIEVKRKTSRVIKKRKLLDATTIKNNKNRKHVKNVMINQWKIMKQ